MCRKNTGFTLIELLVVIAIIAILAAILFPVLMSAKESARTSQCLNNMMQLSKGFRLYVDDWQRYPGPGWGAAQGSQDPNTWGTDPSNWVITRGTWSPTAINTQVFPEQGSLWRYIRNKSVYVCPSDSHQWRTISGRPHKYFGLSYSLNHYFAWNYESKVRDPSHTIMLVDEGAGTYVNGVLTPIVDGHFGDWADQPAIAHTGGCNFGYPDGHTKWMIQKQFKTLRWQL